MRFKNAKYIALSLLAVSVAAGALTSCTDKIEVPDLEYKEDENFAPPKIDPSWELTDISSQAGTGAYAYKDTKYDRLFTRYLGWNGGDGVQTTLLPDGNLWWTFNDSFYGVVDEDRARHSCSFPRNTVMVQEAHNGKLGETEEDLHWLASFVQTDNPDGDRYYHARTHIRHPLATLTDAEIEKGEIDSEYLYWAGDGTVVDGKLQQIWAGVHTIDGAMIPLNTCIATYSLEGKIGDESYLKMIDVDHERNKENPFGYGSTLWEDEDGHTYLYASMGNGTFSTAAICARTTTHDLFSQWEYYVPNDAGEMQWQTEYPSELQAKNSSVIEQGQGSVVLPWVIKEGDKYYMVAQGFLSTELWIFRADHPWGPFTDKRVLLRFTNPLDALQYDKYGNQYAQLYMLHLHMGLSRQGELVISTNTAPGDAKDENGNSVWGFARQFNNPGSADWYRPFFFRIFKWQRVFNY